MDLDDVIDGIWKVTGWVAGALFLVVFWGVIIFGLVALILYLVKA